MPAARREHLVEALVAHPGAARRLDELLDHRPRLPVRRELPAGVEEVVAAGPADAEQLAGAAHRVEPLRADPEPGRQPGARQRLVGERHVHDSHHAVAMRARRPVSAQRAPSTAQPPMASTSSNRASRKKLRRRRLMQREYGRRPVGGIGRDDDSASSFRPICSVYIGAHAGSLGADRARRRPAAAVRREAGAADRPPARAQCPRAEGHGRRRRSARRRAPGAMEAPEDEARAAGTDRRDEPPAT